MVGGGDRKGFGQTNVSQAARPRLHSLAADLQNLGQVAPGASKRYNALQVRGPGNRASRSGSCCWGAPRVPRAPWWRRPEGRGRGKGRRLGAERRGSSRRWGRSRIPPRARCPSIRRPARGARCGSSALLSVQFHSAIAGGRGRGGGAAG